MSSSLSSNVSAAACRDAHPEYPVIWMTGWSLASGTSTSISGSSTPRSISSNSARVRGPWRSACSRNTAMAITLSSSPLPSSTKSMWSSDTANMAVAPDAVWVSTWRASSPLVTRTSPSLPASVISPVAIQSTPSSNSTGRPSTIRQSTAREMIDSPRCTDRFTRVFRSVTTAPDTIRMQCSSAPVAIAPTVVAKSADIRFQSDPLSTAASVSIRPILHRTLGILLVHASNPKRSGSFTTRPDLVTNPVADATACT